MPPSSSSFKRVSRAMALAAAVFVAAPVSAHASTLILRPSADQLAGWTAIPSGPRFELLNDAVLAPTAPSTATDYLTSTSTGTQIVQGDLTNATVPAGETVTGGTVWAYLATGTARTITFGASDSTHAVGFRTVAAGSPEGWYPVAIAESLTQAQVNALFFTATHSGGSGSANFLYALYVQLDTPAPPSDPDPPPSDPPPSDPPPSDPPPSDPPPSDPPVLDPPVLDPPVLDPPVLDPPVVDPPVLDPPVVDPPVLDPALPDPTVVVPPTTPTVPTVPPVVPPVETDLPKPDSGTGGVVQPALAIVAKDPVATPAGDVPVVVACPATEVDGCTGVMWLEETLDAGSASQGIRAARRTNPKRFSKNKRYKLNQGQKKTIPVRLDRRVHRRFKNKRSFKATVVAQQKDSTGQVLTMRRNVRVFNKKKGKRG